ncbi:beta-ketoacyl-ACP synthase III [Baekduia soli]|uniref:Beta-ketoacyl-[acyl-carrier-protein] synthase III n=1 Tax=Baekduia soli TaxID=496014 RepID=A0A5B8U2L1_9ACTN|nr:beta-ketoacyl-ACP synthase 3 [Baekduia soli]QEC47200.1 beta-ketoacyl-ACP synthase III [Baekduia soli]
MAVQTSTSAATTTPTHRFGHSAPVGVAPRRRLGRPLPKGTVAGLFGVGIGLPEAVVGNDHFESTLDTTDEWIVRRTGIRSRHWLAEGEPIAPLAAEACLAALRDAGRTADEVDQIIVTTITPDRVTPGLAPEVARLIGAHGAAAVDLNAACAGFLYALDQAAALVETGRARVVLVCGAEALSRLTDLEDRGTAVLFGDGAGAVVVAAGELDRGCPRFVLGCDPEQGDLLYADNVDRKLRMEGREVYRHAVARMVQSTHEALEAAGLQMADIDLFVAHQANSRIIEVAAAEMGLPPEKVVMNVDRVANTSSASIPLALAQAEADGRLRPGATIAMTAFGAGFVWGAGIVSWKERRDVRA